MMTPHTHSEGMKYRVGSSWPVIKKVKKRHEHEAMMISETFLTDHDDFMFVSSSKMDVTKLRQFLLLDFCQEILDNLRYCGKSSLWPHEFYICCLVLHVTTFVGVSMSWSHHGQKQKVGYPDCRSPIFLVWVPSPPWNSTQGSQKSWCDWGGTQSWAGNQFLA